MPIQPVPEDLSLPTASARLTFQWLEEPDLPDLARVLTQEDFAFFPNRPSGQTVEAWKGHVDSCSKGGIWLVAVRHRVTGELLCLTSYMDWRPVHLGVEIGHTLVASAHRGTWVNPAVKLELLSHAFEKMGLNRVQFKAHALNLRSRKAIQKIGAQFEGVLRQNTRMWDGSWRDTAYYSILAVEWPQMKPSLEAMSAEPA